MLEMQNGVTDDCSSEQKEGNANNEDEAAIKKFTAFEKLSHDISNNPKFLKDVTLGKRIGFYKICGKLLGKGNFSHVKLGIHTLTEEIVAIKILDKTKLDQKAQKLLPREIANMEKLHHPNIIRLYEVIETLSKLHIIMEYAGGGELYNKISSEGKLPEPEAQIIYSQLVAALDHMHSLCIIHRDVKAENVFYTTSRCVKLGDFGFSTTSAPENFLNTFCGSPPYAAPELFKDESYMGIYVDIWAMGILLYFIVTGIMPFRSDTVAKLKKCILDGSYVIPSYISDSCQFLIRGILKAVPQDRFTIDEIKKSDWLEGQKFPAPLEQYGDYPSLAGVNDKKVERITRQELSKLGITVEHFRLQEGRHSRSSVTGTYRIIRHKIHNHHLGISDVSSTNVRDFIGATQNETGTLVAPKQASKFCVIL